jgi:hypothetical protein
MVSLLVIMMAAVLLAGCGGPSVEEYKMKALEIHTMTGEEISLIMMDLSEADITSDEEAVAVFESGFEEGLKIVEANLNDLQGLDVPSQAEEVHAELLDLYQETADVFKGLLVSLETLDTSDQASIDQFLEGMYDLQGVGEKGSEIVDKIEALRE